MEWDYNTIEELAQVITQYDLTEIEIRNGESQITLKKSPSTVQMIPNNQGFSLMGKQTGANMDFRRITTAKAQRDAQIEVTNEMPNNEELEKPSKSKEFTQKYVVSPLAGIFYRQSQPGNPPYAEVGQSVKKGDIVCLVEAMKMINEIAANRDGVIKEFLAENEQFVEYGSPLVLIEEE